MISYIYMTIDSSMLKICIKFCVSILFNLYRKLKLTCLCRQCLFFAKTVLTRSWYYHVCVCLLSIDEEYIFQKKFVRLKHDFSMITIWQLPHKVQKLLRCISESYRYNSYPRCTVTRNITFQFWDHKTLNNSCIEDVWYANYVTLMTFSYHVNRKMNYINLKVIFTIHTNL